MAGSLKQAEVAAYRTDGFLCPIRIAEETRAGHWRREMEEAESVHGKLHYLPKAHLLMPLADELARHPRVLDAVESVLGPDILLWDSAFIVKEPGDGKKVSWHQDMTYWGLEPDDVVSVWLALSPATLESGCMLMMPGTHLGPLVRHNDNKAGDNILSRGQTIDAVIDEGKAAPVVLRPGELSLHHGKVWHGSSPNRSGDRRIAFNAQYIAPWVRQKVGDWDSAMLVRGSDAYGHFAAEAPPTGAFVPAEVAEQRSICDRRASYLKQGAA